MVVKIKTTSALGLALAHTGEGEAQNVVVQVMNTNDKQANKIKRNFYKVTKR